MTKGTPNELEQYNATQPLNQMINSGQWPTTIILPPREAYVWQRWGGAEKVREMIAPRGTCCHCAEAATNPKSYNGWFCATCQRDLGYLGLLSPRN